MIVSNRLGDDFILYSYLDNGKIFAKTTDEKFTLILTTLEKFKNGMIYKPIKGSNDNRIGLTYLNNKNELMTIVEYIDSSNIKVQFNDENKAIVHTTFTNFKNGEVNNPYRKSYYGVGYIGEGFKPSKSDKSMACWSNMLKRVYNENFIKLHPTYEHCSVCDEWLNFQNFHIWYVNNYYEFENQTMCLDKDILIKGNKLYSPETAIFVPQFINKLFTKRTSNRGNYPIGVHKVNNKFAAECSVFDIDKNKSIILRLGRFDTPDEAFYKYKEFKEGYIKNVAEYYKDKLPKKLVEAMINYTVDIYD